MKPAQVSQYLRKIAAAIGNSKNPRPDLVVEDLKQVVAAINPNDVPPWAEERPTREEKKRIREDLGEEPYEAKRDIEREKKLEGWEDDDYDEGPPSVDPDYELPSYDTMRKMYPDG